MPRPTSARGRSPAPGSPGAARDFEPAATHRRVRGRAQRYRLGATAEELPTSRCPKPGEPHGRLQGATDLQRAARSKPSKSGGTTRTERASSVVPARRWSSTSSGAQRSPYPGEAERKTDGRERTRSVYVDGGAIFGQPQERISATNADDDALRCVVGSRVSRTRRSVTSSKKRSRRERCLEDLTIGQTGAEGWSPRDQVARNPRSEGTSGEDQQAAHHRVDGSKDGHASFIRPQDRRR
jgi:hypothetical protein